MNLLLDSHILLWFILDDIKLKPSFKKEIENLDNKCYVSMASLWEIAIKKSIGKIILEQDLPDFVSLINNSGINIIHVELNHIYPIVNLEYHHRDPFDRIIISQSLIEDFTIITNDDKFKLYGVKLL